jgi:hypothetical protein
LHLWQLWWQQCWGVRAARREGSRAAGQQGF